MMKIAALLALVGSAAAFAPAQQGRVNSAVAGKFDGELGAMAPLGFFDPLGLLADESQEQFDRLREVEIKHGRVSMLAVAGYLTTASGLRFPGCEDIPDGFASFPALYAQGVDGQNVLGQMVAFFAVAEIVNREATWAEGVKAEFPGDYRNGAIDYGWDKLSDEDKFNKRTIELNNGRAAQMGILGLMVHEKLGVSILPGNILPGH
eukprot:CAMPEP_0201605948 /NCGR_PEP_ID=MMETSP0492-20130828/5577_1 /ASSEMBLY_ACC=CAM_ASM_000837 /TAXON_ID=420259 /ORGANISM="Thalassiosira gravida, Strain GMp14c1" /LENGTH=205 /DNA_ID=CAMNT_0048070275 /DNA_START=30 /DNA_END=647 /DNA_ORIENTATION=+